MALTKWLPVPEYEELYEVSDEGQIRTLKTGLIRKPSFDKDGYIQVSLYKRNKGRQKKVHRLVAQAFLGQGGSLEVNHKNGIKTDNTVTNLEWVTRAYNMKHSIQFRNYKIKDKNVKEIHRLKKEGWTQQRIATRFRVSQAYISDILKGKTRKLL